MRANGEKNKLKNLFPVFQQFSAAKTNIKLSKANLYFSGEKCEKCSREIASVIFSGNKIFLSASCPPLTPTLMLYDEQNGAVKVAKKSHKMHLYINAKSFDFASIVVKQNSFENKWNENFNTKLIKICCHSCRRLFSNKAVIKVRNISPRSGTCQQICVLTIKENCGHQYAS